MNKVLVTRRNTVGRPSKLSEDAKDHIVSNFNCGETQKELAERYRVSVSTIKRVIQERRPEN